MPQAVSEQFVAEMDRSRRAFEASLRAWDRATEQIAIARREVSASHRRRRAAAHRVFRDPEVTDLRKRIGHLQEVLKSRSVIDQAVGVIVAELGCPAEYAFQMLVRQSQSTRTRLRVIAGEVVFRAERKAPRNRDHPMTVVTGSGQRQRRPPCAEA